jgi:ABC-type uncharacterized transport system substrate-binding protein
MTLTSDKLEKISVTWAFDEKISPQILIAYDRNKNGKFDQPEINEMYSVLSKLENSHFMTAVVIDNSSKNIYKIENFNAIYKDKTVIYTFDLILNYPLKMKNKVEIFFADFSGALAFLYDTENSNIKSPPSLKLKKTFGFKVLQDKMAVVNAMSIDIQK